MILGLTADALRDLVEHALFVAASDHVAAGRETERLREEIKRVARLPADGRQVRIKGVKDPVRRWSLHPFVVTTNVSRSGSSCCASIIMRAAPSNAARDRSYTQGAQIMRFWCSNGRFEHGIQIGQAAATPSSSCSTARVAGRSVRSGACRVLTCNSAI
jgi:plasmid stabilization system protein ParE